jgi:hypothetical protein
MKKRIVVLESPLTPKPIFTQPLAIRVPEEHSKDSSKNISKVRRAQALLQGAKEAFL